MAHLGLYMHGKPRILSSLEQAHLGLCPHREPGSLSGLDLGSTCHLGLCQPLCGPSTENTPHICQWCFFAEETNGVSTAQLSKWP